MEVWIYGSPEDFDNLGQLISGGHLAEQMDITPIRAWRPEPNMASPIGTQQAGLDSN